MRCMEKLMSRLMKLSSFGKCACDGHRRDRVVVQQEKENGKVQRESIMSPMSLTTILLNYIFWSPLCRLLRTTLKRIVLLSRAKTKRPTERKRELCTGDYIIVLLLFHNLCSIMLDLQTIPSRPSYIRSLATVRIYQLVRRQRFHKRRRPRHRSAVLFCSTYFVFFFFRLFRVFNIPIWPFGILIITRYCCARVYRTYRKIYCLIFK